MGQLPAVAPSALLRRKAVEHETGCSRSTLYLRVSQGLFTEPVKLGPRSVGWPAAEVAAINRARIAGQGDEQVRRLVERLHQARQSLASWPSPSA